MKTKFVLGFVLLIAFFLRVWQIHIIPFGFTPDEASFGYDAYSILKTGRDQWGHLLPIMLESFGDYKLPLYSYLAIPFVSLFGLNIVSTRLPNAMVGVLAVLVTYLMVTKLLKTSKSNNSIALISAFLLAVSPWHVMMSRGAFEANLTTLLMPLGVYFFLRGFETKLFFTLSTLVFGLNLFSYHSARLITPLVLLGLIFFNRNELMGKLGFVKSIWKFKVPLFVFGLFLAAAAYTVFVGGARRAQDISIFSGAVNEASDKRFAYLYQGVSQNTARVLVNKYQVITNRFFTNYFQYFSPKFLVIDGPAEATYGMLPGRGIIYWFELPLLLAFFWTLAKASQNKSFRFLLFWVLVAPIPAALTVGSGYAANRAETMLPVLTVIAAIGFLEMYKILTRKLNPKLVTFVYSFICLFSLLSFSVDYFKASPYKSSKAMLWGRLDAAYWLSQKSQGFSNIVVSRSLSEPHIYIAFANVWDSKQYQENSKNWQSYKANGYKFLDQMDGYSLGKYTFSSIDYKVLQVMDNTLIVGKPEEFPADAQVLTRFIAPDGSTAIVVTESQKELYAKKLY